MNKPKPILVTGSHRSGSTWIGKILALPREVKYISEPFNPKIGLKQIKDWFLYINQDNQDSYVQAIDKLLKFKGDIPVNLPALKYWSNAFLPGVKRPLLKDPIACMSADWLARKFNMQVVVIVRHPAAFYASLKRVNWHFDFANFSKQDRLMADYLADYRSLIVKEHKSFVEEAATLWLCIYHVLDRYLVQHPDWIVVRHEDVSLQPVAEFKRMYLSLGLNMTSEIEQQIIKSSGGHNQVEATPGQELDLNRDSSQLVKNWKKHVTDQEASELRLLTNGLAAKYYTEQDWSDE